MRITNGKVYLDDMAHFRTDGYSVEIRDPVGTTLVLPVELVYEIHQKIEERLGEQGVSDR